LGWHNSDLDGVWQNEPRGQGCGVTVPVGQNDPSEQAINTEELGQKEPRGHNWAALKPVVQNDPGGHTWGITVPDGQNEPNVHVIDIVALGQ
jgi:hypothetical protein